MAVLAALMCILVVVSLSTVAVSNSLGSLSALAQNRNSLLSVDAASAGVDAELAAIKAALPGTVPGAAIPCSGPDVAVTQVQAAAGQPNIADAASLETYTLSLGAPTLTVPALGPRMSVSNACSAATYFVPSGSPWYLVIQSRGNVSARSGGNGRTLQALVKVGNKSTAFAKAVDLSLLNSTVAYTGPAQKADNNGSGSNAPITNRQGASIPVADNFAAVAAATEIAEANTDGSSYSCAGDLSGGGAMTGGSFTSPCGTSGNTSGGVWLDLSSLPGVAPALAPLLADLRLNFDAVTSWATASAGSTTLNGSASVVNGTVSLTLLSGVTVGPLPLGLPAGAVTAPTSVAPLIVSVLQGNVLTAPLAGNVGNALSQTVAVTAGYQSSTGGVETVDGLQVSLLNAGVATAAVADFAVSSAGLNTTNNSFTLQGTKQV